MALTDKQERGLMYGFREATFALLEMHDKEVATLKAQLTRSQGRIAELEGAIRENGKWWGAYNGAMYCVFCNAAVGNKHPHAATCIVLTLPEQQPTTGTGEEE